MKKLLSIALAGTMMLSLAACGQKAGATKVTTEATAGITAESEIKTTEAVTETLEETTQAEPTVVTITHSSGTTEVPFNPEKVAVLDLAVLDVFDAMGLGDRVVGIPKKSSVSYLTSYIDDESLLNFGSVKEVDMEALNSAEPDLIIIGGRLASEYDNLSKIAPTICIKADNEAGYMNSTRENADKIASLFGIEDKVEELFAGFDARIAVLKEAAEGKTVIMGLVTSGSLSTLGNGSRCSIISNEIGFENVAADVDSTHGDSASFELLLDKNPDYMFILDRDTAINAEGAKVAQEVMENEIVQKTIAYQNETIIYLTPDVWYLTEGGITATDTMIKDLEVGMLGK